MEYVEPSLVYEGKLYRLLQGMVGAVRQIGREKYLVELAFSGDTAQKAELDQLYAEIGEFLTARDLLSPEQFSKTNYYFDVFK